MKHYYINYYRNFSNTFTICWVEAGSKEEKEIERDPSWERITRKEAIRKCANERDSEKIRNYSFGSTVIAPYGYIPYDTEKYIVEKNDCAYMRELEVEY